MGELARKTKRYSSDLTDEEWAQVEPLMPRPSRLGRKPSVDLREVLNAIRYLARSAGGWRMLPVHFGPWQTVYWWFRRFVRRLLFRTIHDVALMLDREAAGREASPTGGVLDSQTVKAPFAEVRGYDGGKRVAGRKRHVAVDTDGRLLMVNLTPADVSDSAGAQTILTAIRRRWPWLKHLFADAGYDRTKLMDKAGFLDFVVEIVRRSDPKGGFTVLPRRWVVERTMAALAPGGLLVLEGFTPAQEGRRSGGPRDPALLWSVALVREHFAGLELLECLEGTVLLDEGPKHQGYAEVVRAVLRK